MLYRDSSAECGYSPNVAVSDGFSMIEEPVKPIERNIAIDLLKYV
jgi:hypothetical protein